MTHCIEPEGVTSVNFFLLSYSYCHLYRIFNGCLKGCFIIWVTTVSFQVLRIFRLSLES
jgi:hypothetical protein